MAYFTKVCIYYKDAKGNQQMALADKVVFDMPDDVAEKHIADGNLREATKGEIAEAAPAMMQQKPKATAKPAEPKPKATAKPTETTPADGAATPAGGAEDDDSLA